MAKKTIICVVGASGSGKTTICLEHERVYGVPMVVSYTTRPMRDGETDGVDHYFVGKDEVPDKSGMLAYTVFGDNEYWVQKSQIDGCVSGCLTYVVDEDGIRFFEERYKGVYGIVKVKVVRDDLSQIDDTRKSRDDARVALSDDDYDIILHNDGTVADACRELHEYLVGQGVVEGV